MPSRPIYPTFPLSIFHNGHSNHQPIMVPYDSTALYYNVVTVYLPLLLTHKSFEPNSGDIHSCSESIGCHLGQFIQLFPSPFFKHGPCASVDMAKISISPPHTPPPLIYRKFPRFPKIGNHLKQILRPYTVAQLPVRAI